MQVTVIIPVYRAEAFVRRAVESALMQPEVATVLLIEDGSPGNDLAVCREMAESIERVQLLRHPRGRNRGAGPSRNLGLAHAQTELVAFLDADDAYLAGRFEKDLHILMCDTGIDGVYNAIAERHYAPDLATWQDDLTHLTTVQHGIPPERLALEMGPLGDKGHFHLDGLTLRRSALAQLEPFVDLELSQDTEWCVRLAATCRLLPGKINIPVAVRGVHAGNRIKDRAVYLRCQLPLYKRLLSWAVRTHQPRDLIVRLWHAYMRAASRVRASPSHARWLALRSLIVRPQLLREPAVQNYFPRWQKLFRLVSKHSSPDLHGNSSEHV